ncbi:MAG: zinc ribbon domain-containing protein [Verrucomicrobia bacterium]|nr:zinc ribbon domain-containing protein [Verrucomicrobiota bacterium]MCH8510608.1 zinc ribbon domain-containing protein [Kiritimatiellia bacterium]
MTYQKLLTIPETFIKTEIQGKDAFLAKQVLASIRTAQWLVNATLVIAAVSILISVAIFMKTNLQDMFFFPFWILLAGIASSLIPFFVARLYLLHLHRAFCGRVYEIQVSEREIITPAPPPETKIPDFEFCHHCGTEIMDSPAVCPHCGKNISK